MKCFYKIVLKLGAGMANTYIVRYLSDNFDDIFYKRDGNINPLKNLIAFKMCTSNAGSKVRVNPQPIDLWVLFFRREYFVR